MLYQLSYAHHYIIEATTITGMARPAGFEPATHGLEGRCSIQLSYGRSMSVQVIPNALFKACGTAQRVVRIILTVPILVNA